VYQVEVETGTVGADGSITFDDARVTVTVGQPVPPPPPPGPPNPPPPPPQPDDQLTLDLRSAISADAGDNVVKAKQVADLITLYRMAVTTADDPKLTTAGDLLTILRTAANAVIPPDALKGTRTRIGRELGTALPTDPAAQLTPALRGTAKTLFGRIADALGKAAPK
jgi:hypothetical protein